MIDLIWEDFNRTDSYDVFLSVPSVDYESSKQAWKQYIGGGSCTLTKSLHILSQYLSKIRGAKMIAQFMNNAFFV